ncbi:tetratricopeptide repeat protein [Mangrovimonas xylaniphaga]|uniref:tetratricopeptide repeat protein n=1 Tax=Mangrovimonas xylaniphaga TaxID=1645915 RepID=UPI0006B59210|nr:hypothetical protein [Mangrovimonas xylaniphaga]
MNRLIIFFLFSISIVGCKNKTYNEEQDKIIDGDFYKNNDAADLNKNGIDLSKSGDLKKGRESFLKALEIEPNNPTTLSNLGLNYYLTEDYDNAIKYYKESYKTSDSTYHIAAVNLGLTYYYNEEFDKGIEITNYVINNAQHDEVLSSAYVHRALNFLGNNRCDDAQADLNYIIKNFKRENNVEYHINDLKKRIKNCVQHRL